MWDYNSESKRIFISYIERPLLYLINKYTLIKFYINIVLSVSFQI
jgi:hypothetical protein